MSDIFDGIPLLSFHQLLRNIANCKIFVVSLKLIRYEVTTSIDLVARIFFQMLRFLKHLAIKWEFKKSSEPQVPANLTSVSGIIPDKKSDSVASLFWLDDDYSFAGESWLKKEVNHENPENEAKDESCSSPSCFENTLFTSESGDFWLEDTYGLHKRERLVNALLAKDDSEFLKHEKMSLNY
uniref:Uncharacterized protein n=1 Tax=Syphacia muris TaxID=451379 RepID=A0A0N5AJ05_9BILA